MELCSVQKGFEILVVIAVRLYPQDFAYQASYKPTSLDLHVVVEESQSGFGWEHTQFVVNFLQTFALSKQLRAHPGMLARSTSGFPGIGYDTSPPYGSSNPDSPYHVFPYHVLAKGRVEKKVNVELWKLRKGTVVT